MDRKPGLQVNRVSIIPVKFWHLLISMQVHQTDLRLCCGAMNLWCCHFTLTRRKINVYRWKNLKSETNRSKVRLFEFYGEKTPQYQQIRIVRLTVTFFSGFLLGGWKVKQLFFTNDDFSSRHDRFSILKILQKFGSLKKFDFLYHKSGPDQGKSRGYCFASYDDKAVSFKACADLEKIFQEGQRDNFCGQW